MYLYCNQIFVCSGRSEEGFGTAETVKVCKLSKKTILK